MPADLETTAPSPEQPQARAQSCRSMRTHKSSCIEHDSQSEQVMQPGTNAPRLAPSLQAPGAFAEDPDEAGGATTVEPGAPAPLVDPDGTQSTFTAKIADTGAPDPRTVSDAMRCPNWPLREEPIEEEPDAHKARPVAQGSSQMSGVDTHAKVACVAANLGHAHWEAVERTLHHLSGTPDPPPTHVEASSPSEGHANANPDGNMAKYRRAILGHASLTDSGAVPWSSKRQDIAPSESLTTESDYIAAMHSVKEASWLHSPTPDISANLTGSTTSIPDITAIITLTHYAPHREVIDTLDWAALAMRPDTTLSHTNGSTAVDWRTILGHAFPIDGALLGISWPTPLFPSTIKSPTCSRRPGPQQWWNISPQALAHEQWIAAFAGLGSWEGHAPLRWAYCPLVCVLMLGSSGPSRAAMPCPGATVG